MWWSTLCINFKTNFPFVLLCSPSGKVGDVVPKKSKTLTKQLTDLSQTVKQNSTQIAALATLPEVMKTQQELLQKLLVITQPAATVTNEEIVEVNSEKDPVGDFMSGVFDSLSSGGKAFSDRIWVIF